VSETKKYLLLIFASAMILTACEGDNHPIPEGIYQSDATSDEKLIVKKSEIIFNIRVKGREVDANYKYTVLPDNTLQPYPIASSDMQLGVGAFDWFWDGKAIVREQPQTSKRLIVRKTK